MIKQCPFHKKTSNYLNQALILQLTSANTIFSWWYLSNHTHQLFNLIIKSNLVFNM